MGEISYHFPFSYRQRVPTINTAVGYILFHQFRVLGQMCSQERAGTVLKLGITRRWLMFCSFTAHESISCARRFLENDLDCLRACSMSLCQAVGECVFVFHRKFWI